MKKLCSHLGLNFFIFLFLFSSFVWSQDSIDKDISFKWNSERRIGFDPFILAAKLKPSEYSLSTDTSVSYEEAKSTETAVAAGAKLDHDDCYKLPTSEIENLQKKLYTIKKISSFYTQEEIVTLCNDLRQFINNNQKVSEEYFRSQHGYTSYLVTPSESNEDFPIQFNRDGKVFIHLKKAAPLGKGGQGTVSKSLEYHSLNIYANKIIHLHDLDTQIAAMNEFLIPREIESSDLVVPLSYVKYSGMARRKSSGGDDEKVMTNKMAIQYPLFLGDLEKWTLPKSEFLNNPATRKRNIAWARILLRALKKIHDSGYVHRDIKLSNILVNYEDTQLIVKIADFGFALNYTMDDQVYELAGTKKYIAPEIYFKVIKKDWPISTSEFVAADNYALGLVLYYLRYGFFYKAANLLNLNAEPKAATVSLIHEQINNYHGTWKPAKTDSLEYVIWGLLNPVERERMSLEEAMLNL